MDSDSDALGDAIAHAVSEAQFAAFCDALVDADPVAIAITDLVNSVCHCDACHAHADAIHADDDPTAVTDY